MHVKHALLVCHVFFVTLLNKFNSIQFNHATATSLRNFGNSVYPALPVSFGGDTKSSRPLLSGVYGRIIIIIIIIYFL